MHTEHFEVTAELLDNIVAHAGRTAAVGTTTVRTLESLTGLGYRVLRYGSPDEQRAVGQWELYDIPPSYAGEELIGALLGYMRSNGLKRLVASTQIMIMPGYHFRVVDTIITNFHQPKSTLLLLVSAFVGQHWREIYDYALSSGFRFLSYGDSSILFKNNR
jgi:S-adenosylmethionine:tRNA ribosyltransferase-isomerase